MQLLQFVLTDFWAMFAYFPLGLPSNMVPIAACCLLLTAAAIQADAGGGFCNAEAVTVSMARAAQGVTVGGKAVSPASVIEEAAEAAFHEPSDHGSRVICIGWFSKNPVA